MVELKTEYVKHGNNVEITKSLNHFKNKYLF